MHSHRRGRLREIAITLQSSQKCDCDMRRWLEVGSIGDAVGGFAQARKWLLCLRWQRTKRWQRPRTSLARTCTLFRQG